MPLFGWYDYSFGQPSPELHAMWADYRTCVWPSSMSLSEVAERFVERNAAVLDIRNEKVISFSHFLPRIDVMSSHIPKDKQVLYPVLGSQLLDRQIRHLKSTLHVYGHSHVNRSVEIDGISYVNNAFGYPHEQHFAARNLTCVYET